MQQEFDEFGRGYWHCPRLDEKKDSGTQGGPVDTEERNPALKVDANLISSKCLDGLHRPVLDLDIPVRLVPSSTPGNSHLYIDKAMSWGTYAKLLQALQDAGILEVGYAQAAIRRGTSFLRPPGVKKPEAPAKKPDESAPTPAPGFAPDPDPFEDPWRV